MDATQTQALHLPCSPEAAADYRSGGCAHSSEAALNKIVCHHSYGWPSSRCSRLGSDNFCEEHAASGSAVSDKPSDNDSRQRQTERDVLRRRNISDLR